jgi:SOS-response transcriptional repressor LexA
MPLIQAERFTSLRKLRRETQEELGNQLGITGKYVGMIERGEKPVDDQSSLGLLFQMLEAGGQVVIADSDRLEDKNSLRSPSRLREDPTPFSVKQRKTQLIPVVGWAHAGEAVSYEEIPTAMAEKVPTECRDEKAFAVRLEGDSMERDFRDGDLLVVMPSEAPYSGCFVIAKFANDGVTFRRLETAGEVIRLVPLNDRYPVSEHSSDDFTWIYPVWGRWSQLWKR